MKRLSIVIPAYNARGTIEPLADALAALPELADGSYEVLVTDDASTDGTADYLRARYPDFTVVADASNLGFGGNVMRGVEHAAGEFLALVNTDIELRGNPFPALLEALESPHVFAAMPLVYTPSLRKVENLARLYCHRGLCWHTDVAEERELTAFAAAQVNQPEATAHQPGLQPIQAVLCGAFFVVRLAEFRALGGLDARYRPYYWEDVDLGYRAIEHGQTCVTVPSALVVHRHSETITQRHGSRKLHYLLLNQVRFVSAHRRALHVSGLRHPRFWWLLRSLRALVRGQSQLAGAYLRSALGLRV